MTLEYGSLFPITEVKEAATGWTVEGYASTFGNVDLGGDVVMRGAFDALLADPNHKVRFLYAHDQRQVLGTVLELRTDDTGLWGKFAISKTALGADVHTLLKDEALDSFSIGYIPLDIEFDDVGTRLIKDINLLEVSVVPIPMNEQAVVTNVKAPPADMYKTLLDLNVPFEKLLAQVAEWVSLSADEAEALLERRAQEERKLTDAHVAAIESLVQAAKANVDRLTAVITEPEKPVRGPVINVRLELARRRLRQRGILQEA